MSKKSKATFSSITTSLAALVLCLAASAGAGQSVSVLAARRPLTWPHTSREVRAANTYSMTAIASFLDSLGHGPLTSHNVVDGFRFVDLEPGRTYLIAAVRARWDWLEVVSPDGFKFRVVSLGKMPNGSIAMSLADLAGDGNDEVIGLNWVVYRGASTDPIYWYTIYKFRNGMPEDVSAQYPDFYRAVVLGPLGYLQDWFNWVRSAVPPVKVEQFSPGSPHIQLAEIGFVRLRYQHLILGNKNAGLDQAIGWAASSNVNIAVLGVRSLAEMTAPRAWVEIGKLRNSSDYAVCMQARAAWLKKLGRPFTARYECTRAHTRSR
ncbi:MAG: hypothetical protein ACRD11_14680 [Terriglobia bacterium]